MKLTFEEIFKQLNEKKYQPVYFLTGDEPYYIDLVSDYIQENVLNEAEKTFNQTVLYGKDTDVYTLINSSKRFPMMSSHQVVIVKEAQDLREVEKLVHYVRNPLETTILVLNFKYKKLDKRKELYKALEKHSVVLESKKLYDNQLPRWISGYLSSKNIEIEPKASMMLVEFLGSDLSKVANELDKLTISMGDGERMVTAALIERNIGISKDYNNFELQNALGARDVLKANRIINYFADNEKNHPVTLTINILYTFFSRVLIYFWIKDKSQDNLAREFGVNPYFVKDYVSAARAYNANKVIEIISILREYDLKSKGYNGTVMNNRDLLKELIFKILH